MVVKLANSSSECIEQVRHSRIRVHDAGTGKGAVFLNLGKEKVRKIRMDGCLAPVGERAADFVVSHPKIVDVIVELKGRDVDHACAQVEATWAFWRSHKEYMEGHTVGAWMVCTQYPRFNLKVARSQENLRKRGCILLISAHNHAERSFGEFVPR
jgi:hypothetical protein